MLCYASHMGGRKQSEGSHFVMDKIFLGELKIFPNTFFLLLNCRIMPTLRHMSENHKLIIIMKSKFLEGKIKKNIIIEAHN